MDNDRGPEFILQHVLTTASVRLFFVYLFWCITYSKYNIADGMRQMFDPFERVARAHHICPCCERPFSAEEEDDFVKKVVLYILSEMT